MMGKVEYCMFMAGFYSDIIAVRFLSILGAASWGKWDGFFSQIHTSQGQLFATVVNMSALFSQPFPMLLKLKIIMISYPNLSVFYLKIPLLEIYPLEFFTDTAIDINFTFQ